MNGLLIDCFAGGGGASKGIELALNRPIDIAINHDPEAIRIHRVNHPHTLHLTEDIFTVDLPKYVAGRPVDLMWGVYLRAAHPELAKVMAVNHITAKDVAAMMGLLKVARIATGSSPDSFVDLAGYAACAGEIATKEDSNV